MKKIIITFLTILPLFVFAQTGNGIQFETGTWSQAIAKAKETNKLIFLDCYTSWCGPCKSLAENIFTDKTVGEYFNANFINMKMDMEKGEGVELRKKFQVNVFPTLLFVNGDGEVVGRVIGGASKVDDFMKKIKKEVETQTLYKMKKRFDAGERSDQVIFNYLKALDDARMADNAQKVVYEYFKDKKDYSKLEEKKYMVLFFAFVDDVNSDLFLHVHRNRAKFADLYTKRELDNKLYQAWIKGAVSFCEKDSNGVMKLDKKGFKKYLSKMKKEKADYIDVLTLSAHISNAGRLENWEEYMTLLEKRIANPGDVAVSTTSFVNYGTILAKKCKDVDIKRRALPIFEKALKDASDPEMIKKDTKNVTKGEAFNQLAASFQNVRYLSAIVEELKK